MPITGNSIFRVYLEMILDRYGHGTYLHGLGTTMVLLITMRFTPMGCLSPMELMGRKYRGARYVPWYVNHGNHISPWEPGVP